MNSRAPQLRSCVAHSCSTARVAAPWTSAHVSAPRRRLSIPEQPSERRVAHHALAGLASPPESLELATAAGVKKANLAPKQVQSPFFAHGPIPRPVVSFMPSCIFHDNRVRGYQLSHKPPRVQCEWHLGRGRSPERTPYPNIDRFAEPPALTSSLHEWKRLP